MAGRREAAMATTPTRITQSLSVQGKQRISVLWQNWLPGIPPGNYFVLTSVSGSPTDPDGNFVPRIVDNVGAISTV